MLIEANGKPVEVVSFSGYDDDRRQQVVQRMFMQLDSHIAAALSMDDLQLADTSPQAEAARSALLTSKRLIG